jgi:hypothetical protein
MGLQYVVEQRFWYDTPNAALSKAKELVYVPFAQESAIIQELSSGMVVNLTYGFTQVEIAPKPITP